jgi:drug/metabolite transporter (DMT)-like permease
MFTVCLLTTYTSLTVARDLTINASKVDGKVRFVASTVVFLAELGKLLACLVWMIFIKESTDRFSFKASLKYSVPALLYALENNIIFTIYQYLTVANTGVLWNLKIVLVAVLFRVVLGRILTALQWLSVFLLLLGVLTSQAEHFSLGNLSRVCNASAALPDGAAEIKQENYIAGITLAVGVLICGSCAGIYNEWVMKKASERHNSIALQAINPTNSTNRNDPTKPANHTIPTIPTNPTSVPHPTNPTNPAKCLLALILLTPQARITLLTLTTLPTHQPC